MPITAHRRAYMRKYQLAWVQKRRLAWINENGPCSVCGSTDEMEVDHIDPATKDPKLKQTASSIWSWSQARRDVELAKCQVLCADCHKKKSIRQGYKTDHGKPWMYQGHKCRCELCRTWKRNADRKHKAAARRRRAAKNNL